MTVSGTLANLNAALNGLVYTPNSVYSGSDSLHAFAHRPGRQPDRLGHGRHHGQRAQPLRPSPRPPPISVNENSTLVFSTAQGDGDHLCRLVCRQQSPETLTLTATNGTLTLGSTSGLSFTAGATAPPSMTVTGTLANLNAASTA